MTSTHHTLPQDCYTRTACILYAYYTCICMHASITYPWTCMHVPLHCTAYLLTFQACMLDSTHPPFKHAYILTLCIHPCMLHVTQPTQLITPPSFSPTNHSSCHLEMRKSSRLTHQLVSNYIITICTNIIAVCPQMLAQNAKFLKTDSPTCVKLQYHKLHKYYSSMLAQNAKFLKTDSQTRVKL